MICISGTPGTGKSTILNILKGRGYDTKELDNELGECIVGEEDGEKIVDTDCLATIKLEGIVAGHLSHHMKCDQVIIIRSHLREIGQRLGDRGYDEKKMMDNIEAEAIDLIGTEAENIHPGNVYEVLNENIDKAADEVESIIKGENIEKRKFDLLGEMMDWY